MEVVNANIPAAFMPAGIDACCLYRQYIPHLNMDDSAFLIPIATLSDGRKVPGPIDINAIAHCKVAVVQRLVSEVNKTAILTLKQAGLKVIYDLDDNVWSLPGYNPSKQAFDDVGDGFYQCAKEADLITVSTRGLQSATRHALRISKPILVVPNAIDLNLFCKKTITRRDGLVVIGWGGSNTHSADVKHAFECVVEVLNKYPQARMEIVGAPAVGYETKEHLVDQHVNGRNVVARGIRKIQVITEIGRHPQTKFRPWVPIAEYPNRLASWGWDIGLAPLEDNRFNRSKSNLKMLESAAIQIPCLASDVQPYREFAELGGEDVKWLLCSTSTQWINKLTILINEPERREYLGKKMHEVADKWFNITKIKDNWQHAFRTALETGHA